MGTSKKSHGKKTDQETQSPMLKIFKDIIQRDTDPEKTNLLKDNNEDRKKRHYSSSKPKIGHKSESNSSERSRKTVSHKSHETRNLEYDPCRPRSAPFQGDRKESWWFWGEKNSNRDTRSCVSCALKKLGGSEYFCVGCLLLIFAVSVVVAFLLVFRSVPTIAADIPPASGGGMLDSDRLRRKMDTLNEKKAKKDLKADREKREWDNAAWKHLDGQGSLSRTDFGRSGLNDMVSIEGNEKSELSNILDAEKIDEFKSNDRLKDFFKKLAQTDAQIRLLKKGMADPSLSTSESEKTIKKFLERSKRSVNVNHTKLSKKKKPGSISRAKIFRNNSRHRPFYILKREKSKERRNKRFTNNTEPTGLIIEKKKVLVQYLPAADTRKIPKCSHSTKDSKSHETLLKHPFYKNTQRLDEMLDQFIAKNLYDIIDDPDALDLIMKKKKEKCKHPATNEEPLEIEKLHAKAKLNDIKSGEQKISDEEIRKLLQPLVTTKLLENEAKKLAISRPKEESGITPSTQDYELILSISTVLNPEADLATTPSSFERGHIFRKLMQVDEDDDENIGYEDLKEVLTEDLEAHDERDYHGHRKKREDPNQLPQIQNFPNPPGVNNPNWKGAMPLYSDEINSMIKQAALNANKFVLIKNKEGKELFPSKAGTETEDENDVQYIEEYFDSKFNRLVNMAQAYSDYGVLDGKRNGVGTEKAGGDKILEHRVKLSTNGDMLFGRLKKSTPTSEGIRFELRPTTSSREDTPLGVSKLLNKHLRISPERSDQSSLQALGKGLPANPEIDFMLSPTKYDKQFEYSAKTKPFKNYDTEGGSGFNIHRNRRSLKSISDEDLNEMNEEDLINDGKDFDIKNEGLTGVILLEHLNAYNISPLHNTGIKKFKSNDEYKLNGYKNEDSNNSATYTNETNTYFTVKIMRRTKGKNTKQKSAKNRIHNATLKMEPYLKNVTIDPDKILVKNQSEKINKSLQGDIAINNKKTSSISDFFMMLTNFFSFLEDFGLALKLNTSLNSYFTPNDSKNNNISYINISTHLHPSNDSNVTKIGYRSRALLSVNDSMKIDDVQNEATASEISTKATEHSNIANTMNLTQINDASNSTTLKAVDFKANTAAPKDKEVKNKTVVKRNADDSNLIFWNDIYDDEYGVRAEPVENVRDKHAVPKTPSTWFKDKLRRLTDNLHKNPDKRTSKRSAPDKSGFRKPLNRKEASFRRLNKRDLKLVEADEFQPDRSLGALNANMKEVCRKAARAVQQTKNLEVKEDTKESAAATSLMQQLVKLMTDLVDYQVQQRTCLQLPPDLQSFLEWLTGSGQEGATDLSYKRSFQEDFLTELEPNSNEEKPSDHYLSMDMITPTTSEREEVHPEERSDCLGTLRAVQDLILQYNELSEEEKSKMVGIKEYLDNQLDYLEKYIVLVDDLNVNHKNNFPLRFKRNTFRRKVHNEKRNKTHEESKIRQRMKNILKFKNKKPTKTTPHSFAKTTKMSHQEPKKSKAKTYVRPTFEPKILNHSKRNLKDVYYKAVADAKKATTIKNNEEYRN